MVFVDPPFNVPIPGNVSGLGKIQHRNFAMASGEMTEQGFTAFLECQFKLLAAQVARDQSTSFAWTGGIVSRS